MFNSSISFPCLIKARGGYFHHNLYPFNYRISLNHKKRENSCVISDNPVNYLRVVTIGCQRKMVRKFVCLV